MQGISVIVIVKDEQTELIRCCIESIRAFLDVDNIEVIVVNNGNNEFLSQWAILQEDIIYVDMEGVFSYGSVLNQVIEGLNICNDIMILDPAYMVTPGSFTLIPGELYQSDLIGALGGISNSSFYNQTQFKEIVDCDNYEDLINFGAKLPRMDSKRVIGLCADAVVFKKNVIEDLGLFDEKLTTKEAVIKDYCLRMIESDFECRVCENILFYSQKPDRYWEDIDEDNTILEKKWGMHYFNVRYNEHLIDMISEEKKQKINVLEIGCDCAATLVEIKNRYHEAKIYGCELNPAAVRISNHFAETYVNNIEEKQLPFSDIKFDYIIFGDVLEHLRDPLEVIKYCKKYIKPNGYIISSIPNVMHISVIEDLLRGNFTYTETGLLDKTHIHLFTYNEIIRMFYCAGYKIEEIAHVQVPISIRQRELIEKLQMIQSGTEKFMYEAFQYLIKAKNNMEL